MPSLIRTALALALTPLVADAHPSAAQSTAWLDAFLHQTPPLVFTGAACGLCAALVANAASAAGATIDAALASPPTGGTRLFGSSLGPFGSIYALGYAVAMFSSGAATQLISVFVEAARVAAGPAPTTSSMSQVVDAGFRAALGLAAPAIFAQTVSAIVCAAIARVAPRSNGMLLASAMGSLLAIAGVLVGIRVFFPELIDIAHRSVGATRALFP